MKYRKAQDILPNHLVKELQKYASGDLIYIPKPKDKHLKWGERSGGRQYVDDRNKEIKERFLKGYSIEILANQYHLSVDSIKKIVYT